MHPDCGPAAFSLLGQRGMKLTAFVVGASVLLGSSTLASSAVASPGAWFGAGPSGGSPAEADEGAFDREAAATALAQLDLSKCKAPTATRGEGHVKVTFGPSGSATQAVVDKGPMVGTPVQRCLENVFKKAKVPPYKGGVVHVGKTFRFD